ncbi:MAG: hypothetical protein HZC28_10085 [Spirochaetes bacterium]|nr:hypothetical protein [Spirochaetota bacterium]
MKSISYISKWKLSFTHPLTKKKHTIPAAAPGSIAADLMRAKVIPDLYVGANVLVAQQWERTDFTYTAAFTAPELKKGERLELNFGGVDTVADVVVNGKQVGYFENMFIPHTVDITKALAKKGKNTLMVTIHNVLDYSSARVKRWGIDGFEFNHLPAYENIFVRKAQHMFGWDIAPRILFGGIQRPVTMQIRRASGIIPEEFYFAVRSLNAEKQQASVDISYGLSLDPDTNWREYELRIEGRCGDSSFSRITPIYFTHGKAQYISISNAKLWWPAGYGEQHLYDISVKLLHKGREIDEYKTRAGIRTAVLDFNADLSNTANNRFQIKVNGVGIFARGSNWVPADALHDGDAERIKKILPMFTDTHCNIVRCWGGSVYEDHAFFEYCDEHGIMVWQDFMFGCARYPQNDEFLAQVRDEAVTIIRKLRNHPSLVLWAGDNEIDSSYTWSNPGHTPPSANKISRVVLKEAVAYHDPFRSYLPSSPFVTDEMHFAKRHDDTPEQHLWGPRGYFKDDFYAKNTAIFASEIGYHGMPAKKSMARFLSKEKVWGSFNNNEWILHAASPQEREDGPMGKRNYLMQSQVKHLFGNSVDQNDIDNFILASKITQAEAKKYFIEHFRSRKPASANDLSKPHKTGIIWWNMIDCWPQFSDAIVDYYYEKKLAYEYIKRSQTPVCIMVAENSDERDIVAVNDTLAAVHGEWKISADNALVKSGTFDIAPNGSVRLGTLEKSAAPLFNTLEWTANGTTWRNHYVQSAAPWDFSWYVKQSASFRGEL